MQGGDAEKLQETDSAPPPARLRADASITEAGNGAAPRGARQADKGPATADRPTAGTC